MTHDLHDFIRQLGAKMEAEYTRIRKAAASDPGTAGDEGEENWAQLLRDWLPPSYHVVTKGQLLDVAGTLSPQVDVLVLKPSYPSSLHHKKKYLAAGVAAAFECKLTLRREHIFKTMETAAFIKRMSRKREGTPFRELVAMTIFGLLAHSHSWGGAQPTAQHVELIGKLIEAADIQHVQHPREMLDLLCISDLATWVAERQPLLDPEEEIDPEVRASLDATGVPATYYMCHAGFRGFIPEQSENFNPLGVLLGSLFVKLAWEDPSLRDIADYFMGVDFSSTSHGIGRQWQRSIYSSALRRKLTLKRLAQVSDWDEWSVSLE